MAKKNLSEIEKGGGFFLGLLNSLMDAAREKSVPFAAIHRLATDGGKGTIGKIVDLAYADWQDEQPRSNNRPKNGEPNGAHPYRSAPSNRDQALPPDHYLVHITYAAVPSRTELEKEYSDKNSVSEILDGRAWELHESCKGMDEAPGERIFWTAAPPVEMLDDSEKIIAWAAAQKSDFAPKGYRPATHQEEIEFARKHPELQKKFWIVALGSFAMDGGNRYVAVLRSASARRVLYDVCWFDFRWASGSRFLLVRR
jgi:hypothetical protein